MKVFLGVGHGGSDPGAMGNGFLEKDLNLAVATHCYNALIENGVQCKMSRTKDEDDTLKAEIDECNAYDPDIAVDIHNNAGGGNGFEVFHHYGGGKGKILAEKIDDAVKTIGQNSRGLKIKTNSSGSDYFGFIRQTNMPAVIVECAFIDNAEDIAIVGTEEKRKIFGEAIAKGILNYFGKEYKEESPKDESKGTIYRVQVGAFSVKENAENMIEILKKDGYDAFIKEE